MNERSFTEEEERTLQVVKDALLDSYYEWSAKEIITMVVDGIAQGSLSGEFSSIARELRYLLKQMLKRVDLPLPLDEAQGLFQAKEHRDGDVTLQFDDKLADSKVLMFYRKNATTPYRSLEELLVGEKIKLPYTSYGGHPEDRSYPFADYHICDDCDESFDMEEEVVEHWLTTHMSQEWLNERVELAVVLSKDEVAALLPELQQAKRYWDGSTWDGTTWGDACCT